MPRKIAASPKSPPVVKTIPITQARIHLGALVKRVRLNKEYFILEKDGISVAGLMDIDEFEDYLELQDPKVREHIRESSEEYLAGKNRPAEEFLRELRQEASQPGLPHQEARSRPAGRRPVAALPGSARKADISFALGSGQIMCSLPAPFFRLDMGWETHTILPRHAERCSRRGALNLKEPERFNEALLEFLEQIETKRG